MFCIVWRETRSQNLAALLLETMPLGCTVRVRLAKESRYGVSIKAWMLLFH